MTRPSAAEFLQAVLEALEDLPPELARRLVEIVDGPSADRAQVIRQLFEASAGE
jgi:hypothetical protein